MLRFVPRLVFAFSALFLAGWPAAGLADQIPAKRYFGAAKLPSEGRAAAVGFYSKGCLAGGEAITVDGPYWQAMRLSRNRIWGHPNLIHFIEWLGREAATKDGWPGLLLGDMSQPRGGPMVSGHASHQVGLDIDIWLQPMPQRRLSAKERETMSAIPVVEVGPHEVDPRRWTNAHARLIKRAASYPEVQRIFVAPGIKKKLCETATGDRSWLAKVRPYWGHNEHIHVRLVCPDGSPGCEPQRATGKDDGCGAPLAWWYSKEPYRQAKPSKKPAKKRETTLDDLPNACRQVLASGDKPGTITALAAYGDDVPADVAAKAVALRPDVGAPGAPSMPHTLPQARPAVIR
ncbi:penicillin-insensitive murein endopeptidase [Rhodopseudomonas julia]|uniref:Penicillin-insensitive murein endopeptidase n=1 Tax=Rhodopseudomonas julia TaxID=200617 RepID=A0ABU0C4S7_9BRAD|nr:penicillin-insensitive murein endopeptidase [Rhodopseudomonas julia]MDQ0325232.1 penicillin-insensitive murein endopeptidase [Rhodopseudomonas julia]